MTYNEYRKECLKNNVEPTMADFKGIELTYEQIDAQMLRTLGRQGRKRQQKTLAATA